VHRLPSFVTEESGHINPLNAELNPICYLLALLGAHHFLHVSRIRVKNECTLPPVNVCRQAILHLHLITLPILVLTQSLQLTYDSFLQHRSFVCLYD
jgi:hypothetical protein